MSAISLGGRALRATLPFALAALCLNALHGKFEADGLRDLPALITQLPPQAVLLAILATVLSFWAVGRYDLIAHRHLGTGIPRAEAMQAGRVGIALSQTLGLGVLTGALTRWRMLPDLSHTDALRLSGFVCLTFMAALGALVLIALPLSGGALWPAVVMLMALPVLGALAVRFPVIRWRGLSITLPSLRNMASVVFWAMIDVTAAALALYVLMPAEAGSFALFLPAFLLALGAGLLTGSPGGVGPFDLALVTALPHLPLPETLAALAGFRLIYYALPALLGVAALLRPCKDAPPVPRQAPLANAPRAEVGILRQIDGTAEPYRGGSAAFLYSAQTVFAFCDPIAGSPGAMLRALRSHARMHGKIPLLYKATARTALTARRMGWRVLHIADEAVVATHTFDLSTPTHRTLRRKLRQAGKSGVTVTRPARLPIAQLAQIDREWQQTHGAARGGTMGRFAPDYVAGQVCFVAQHEGLPKAFVTFHATRREWCLDIMRHCADLPDGTMHALITAAIDAARDAGVPRLSLAATPACPDPSRAWMRTAAAQISARAGGPGLRQFKSAFAPRWVPLYAAAPGRFALGLGLLDVARSVQWPDPLPNFTVPQEDDEDYEIASSRVA